MKWGCIKLGVFFCGVVIIVVGVVGGGGGGCERGR